MHCYHIQRINYQHFDAHVYIPQFVCSSIHFTIHILSSTLPILYLVHSKLMNALYLSLIFFVKPIFLYCKLDAVSFFMFHSVSCIADTVCECGTSEQTMQHLLRCPLLENECSLEDLATANEKAPHCARAWPNI